MSLARRMWLFMSNNVGAANPHPNSDLLMEDLSFFLMENGASTFLLEA